MVTQRRSRRVSYSSWANAARTRCSLPKVASRSSASPGSRPAEAAAEAPPASATAIKSQGTIETTSRKKVEERP